MVCIKRIPGRLACVFDCISNSWAVSMHFCMVARFNGGSRCFSVGI